MTLVRDKLTETRLTDIREINLQKSQLQGEVATLLKRVNDFSIQASELKKKIVSEQELLKRLDRFTSFETQEKMNVAIEESKQKIEEYKRQELLAGESLLEVNDMRSVVQEDLKKLSLELEEKRQDYNKEIEEMKENFTVKEEEVLSVSRGLNGIRDTIKRANLELAEILKKRELALCEIEQERSALERWHRDIEIYEERARKLFKQVFPDQEMKFTYGSKK